MGGRWTVANLKAGETQLNLRVPAQLRERLIRAAAENRRSVNQEIVYSLDCHVAQHERRRKRARQEAE